MLSGYKKNSMIPGPTYVYQCPKCNNLLKKSSLLSGNTIGSIIYSDGKKVNPMMPEFPNLTICTKCQYIFRISEIKAIGKYGDDGTKFYPSKPEWEKAPYAEFLTVYEYFRLLEEMPPKNTQVELELRIQIWLSFNDRVRDNSGELYNQQNDSVLYNANCERILELIDARYSEEKNKIQKELQYIENIKEGSSFWTPDRIKEITKIHQESFKELEQVQSDYIIMKAEIYRNFGKFEECMAIINNLEKPILKSEEDWDWIKDIFREECESKNTLVVSLSSRVVKYNKLE